MAIRNPWATRKVTENPHNSIGDSPDYPPMVNSRYAVPSLESGSPYNDEFGWSNDGLRPSSVEYPSAQRLMTIPRRDFVPDPVRPPEEFYQENRGLETNVRHVREEYVDADGWQEWKGISAGDKRWADNPRRTPPPETRPTEQMAPRSYYFERPFAQETERFLNGNHFSMADHRRSYAINQYGMEPVRSLRNTYRQEPAPWDINITDMPPDSSPVYARFQGQNLPPGPKSWRLT